MKKNAVLALLFFIFSTSAVYAQKVQIEDVVYNIEGCGSAIFGKTQDYSLSREVPVNTSKVFETEEEFNLYLEDYKKKLSNLRAFESIEIETQDAFEAEEDDDLSDNEETEKIKKVLLVVSVKDSFHLFAIPGPKYDSNTGLTLKLKIIDSNFLGSLSTLSTDVFYVLPTSESDNGQQEVGFNINIDYPFKAGIFDALWLNDLEFSYTFGNDMPEWDIGTGIRFELPLEKCSFVLETNQKFVNDFDYKEFDDNIYFVNDIRFSVPITLSEVKYFGKIIYTPYIIPEINWDFDGISEDNSELSSPILTAGHKFSFGRSDWNNNFRTGFSLSIDNYYFYNFQRNKFYPVAELNAQAHKSFTILEDSYFLRNIGISADFHSFAYFIDPEKDPYIANDGIKIGQYLRGIRDKQYYDGTNVLSIKPTSAFILNLDLPIHIFTTNFTKSFMRYLNFDFQLSPFVDIALCYNKATNSFFDLKDGFYTAGLEAIVYPLKWSGITVRGSIGVDVGRKFLASYLNTDWRQDVSALEFSFGFGLHY